MQSQSFVRESVGNCYERSRTMNSRLHHFQKKIELTILPLFLTTYFLPKFSKLSPTKHRTKNRSYFANNRYVIEVSTATTGPDMTFLFVYFGLKHPVDCQTHQYLTLKRSYQP